VYTETEKVKSVPMDWGAFFIGIFSKMRKIYENFLFLTNMFKIKKNVWKNIKSTTYL